MGVKEAGFSRQVSIDTHLLIGKDSIIGTPDEWNLCRGRELGFRQQVMFAKRCEWRFDTPGRDHYVQPIDKPTEGDLDDRFYDRHIRPIKELSDEGWQRMSCA